MMNCELIVCVCAVSVLFSNLHSKTPGGQDFTENIKHKVGLDCLEIVKSESLLNNSFGMSPFPVHSMFVFLSSFLCILCIS